MASDFSTAIQPPPGPGVELVLPNQAATNPQIFNDALIVRVRVFVDEQNCTAEAEIDSDDARSWHFVIHNKSTRAPAAVIRLVPFPHPPHELLTHPDTMTLSYDWTHEPCIKLTRVAVMPEYRGLGLGRRLVEIALTWAQEHAAEIDQAATQWASELNWTDPVSSWKGLVLIHAQVEVEKMYERLGM
ncbi:hypothetical protein N7495_002015 [Penicillium taxi]|uniref:uncharacterized protein n=1 Tax=Penicillium taxi TaxID=168475 RepID=UPI0025451854|nr:uncharacterized protein N7495_002015 [Penicillium taxi]KAJ5901487.1 hypothetical protein N7495_002015 [Penicillium taxi]